MYRRIALLMLVALLAVSAFGQGKIYSIDQRLTLAAAPGVVTVQLPAGTRANVVFTGVAVYCSVQCEFTLERDGALATVTARQAAPLNASDGAGTAVLYYNSNAGVGAPIARYVVPAGGTLPLNLINKTLTAGQNLTVRTAAITGTLIVNFQWREN